MTVTSVKTSPDLRSARVYVSVLGDEDEREATLAALRSSHGKLQAAIAREVRIKHTPTLSFHYDESLERGVRLEPAARGRDPDERADRDARLRPRPRRRRAALGDRFLLTTHEGPDGDALGSLLAMHQRARASSARTR